MFGRDWQPAEATVIEAISEPKAPKNIVGEPSVGYEDWTYKAVVEVRPAGAAPFRTQLGLRKPIDHFRFPKAGPVGVLLDPKSRKVKWDRDDPRVYSDRDDATRQQDFDAALRAPAGSSPVREPPGAAGQPNREPYTSLGQ